MHKYGYFIFFFTKKEGAKKPIDVYAELGKQRVKRVNLVGFPPCLMSANEGNAERMCQRLPQLRLSD